MDNYSYPCGSDTSSAPWNQDENSEVEVEVTVSITLSKTFKINTPYYEQEWDGEGVSYTFTNLKEDVKQQTILPHEAYHYIDKDQIKGLHVRSDLEGWNVDDFEVIEE